MSKEQTADEPLAQTRWHKLAELYLENQLGCEQRALEHLHSVLSPQQLPYPLLQKAARSVYNTVNRAYAAQRSPLLLIRYWAVPPAAVVSERSWGFFLLERPLAEQLSTAAVVHCIELYCYQDASP